MKAQVKFEWRWKEEPEGLQRAEHVIKEALIAAGYRVNGFPEVQGVWDEDKPAHAGGPWNETRLPHEEITSEQETRITDGQDLSWPLALARGPRIKLQAASGKLQASSGKLDKIKL